jgi:hypothetical protein
LSFLIVTINTLECDTLNKIRATFHTQELLHNHKEIHTQRHCIYPGNPNGKTNFEWLLGLISKIFGYNAAHGSMCILPLFGQQSTKRKKIPLRVKLQEKIGRVGVMGRPTGLTFHFPFPSIFLSYFHFLFY